MKLNEEEKRMLVTNDLMEQLLDEIFETIESWDKLYNTLSNANHDINELLVENKKMVDSPEIFLAAAIGIAVIKGYFAFRHAQPTMTDFELSKLSIIEHAKANLRSASESAIERSMKARSS